MSPRGPACRRKPRSSNSVLDFAERWGISEKSARRLGSSAFPEDAVSVLVAESKRFRAAQLRHVPVHGKYRGGIRPGDKPGFRAQKGTVFFRGRRMRGHKAARQEHARNRAMQRFGLEAGKLVRRELIHKVQAGEVKFARRAHCSRTVIVADYGDSR